jgi:hypothetical protein
LEWLVLADGERRMTVVGRMVELFLFLMFLEFKFDFDNTTIAMYLRGDINKLAGNDLSCEKIGGSVLLMKEVNTRFFVV